MEYKGSTVYDNNEFCDQYIARRHRDESPNKLIENPALFNLLGDVKGLNVLDLGCGDASIGHELLKLECSTYLGIDGSRNMCERAAKKLKGTNGSVMQSTLEDYEYPVDVFDVVVSQLVLHYIENVDELAEKVYRSLKPGGKFVFSVLHPVMTASFKSMTGKRSDWIVDDYFQTGRRVEPWIGEKVVKYHRTIEDYFLLLQHSGFTIQGLREGTPLKENFQDSAEYERRKRIPLFLLFSCEK
ncbi:class I SAM-dependent methyltransferase [Pseudalkalibacillus hwajinpoensis]|uniref:class I SAM-dependent DNA methyltransferase n=1 Tax=Guptibacillus hwajinpoensis TaxID=208199 RepID=UPI00325AA94C